MVKQDMETGVIQNYLNQHFCPLMRNAKVKGLSYTHQRQKKRQTGFMTDLGETI